MNKRYLHHVAALLLCASLCPAPRAAGPASAAEEKITLPAFEVKGNAVCCYGFGVIATWDAKAQRITHLFVETVNPGSEADRIGLRPGDEILAINGKKIGDMKGGAKKGGDLFGLLVDQPVGRLADFVVTVRVVKKIVLTAVP